MSIFDDEPRVPKTGWEKGYHYTSWSNWLKIRGTGLVPTLMSPDKIEAVEDLADELWDHKAIWVWVDKLTTIEHVGSLLYQLAKRGEPKLVTLQVRFPTSHRLQPREELGGQTLQLRHKGSIDRWKYHHDTRSCLVVHPIPPSQIKLLRTVDLLKLLG